MLTSLRFTVNGYFRRLVRESQGFRDWLHVVERLERENEGFRKDFQLACLKEITSHAAKNIPFWQKRFADYDFDLQEIQSVEGLKALPLLTKKEVLANYKDLISRRAWRIFMTKGFTSGTTGSPAVFLRDHRSILLENAILWQLRRQVGMKLGSRLVWLRGDIVVPASKKEPPFWARDWGQNFLKISTYHLISQYKHDILRKIDEFLPSGAFAYPSAVSILASWCLQTGCTLPFPNLHTSSETVLVQQREKINIVLQGHWLDHYGQAERVNLFASINGGEYRDYSEYGVTELLPLENGKYEVIGSTLHNYAMPLFRYQTGDIVEQRRDDGIGRPIIKGLVGRKDDSIVLPDGRTVGRLALVLKGLKNIVEGQFYQPSPENIIIRLVPTPTYSEDDEAILVKNARERLGNEIGLTVEYMDKIPRTNSGKLKFVISDVRPN